MTLHYDVLQYQALSIFNSNLQREISIRNTVSHRLLYTAQAHPYTEKILRTSSFGVRAQIISCNYDIKAKSPI